jgi:hypothetical protein
MTCTGRAPLAVRFAPLATTTVTQYFWDFGDATPFDGELAPNHVYTTPGVYSVRVVATGVWRRRRHQGPSRSHRRASQRHRRSLRCDPAVRPGPLLPVSRQRPVQHRSHARAVRGLVPDRHLWRCGGLRGTSHGDAPSRQGFGLASPDVPARMREGFGLRAWPELPDPAPRRAG